MRWPWRKRAPENLPDPLPYPPPKDPVSLNSEPESEPWELPPFSGAAVVCAKCGERGAALEYIARHHTNKRLGPDPWLDQERMLRGCWICRYCWVEALPDPALFTEAEATGIVQATVQRVAEGGGAPDTPEQIRALLTGEQLYDPR